MLNNAMVATAPPYCNPFPVSVPPICVSTSSFTYFNIQNVFWETIALRTEMVDGDRTLDGDPFNALLDPFYFDPK